MKKDQQHIKLEEVSRANVHEVPDQYFNKLNADIRKRVEDEKQKGKFTDIPVIKIGTPVAVAAMMALAYFLFWSPNINHQSIDADALLAEVNTDDIIDYLEDIDISEDEILASVDVDVLADDIGAEEGILGHLDIDDEEIMDMVDDLDMEDINF